MSSVCDVSVSVCTFFKIHSVFFVSLLIILFCLLLHAPGLPLLQTRQNLIFLCGALIAAYQKQTYLCCIILYKDQNMSCHKEDITANGRTLCHFSRSIKMAFKIPHACFLH